MSTNVLILLGFVMLSSVLGMGAGVTLADPLRPAPDANDYQRITGEDPDFQSDKGRLPVIASEPATLLKTQLGHLPEKKTGRALDIGMGGGRNAVFLAQQGFQVEGVDISSEAIFRAKSLARSRGVKIRAIQANIHSFLFRPEHYDVVVNIDFLDRSLVPKIKMTLRKGGVLFYENFTEQQLANEHRKDPRRDLLLAAGELKEMFKDFQILYYQEENDGKNAKARLVARRVN